jgi:hypothetical protein
MTALITAALYGLVLVGLYAAGAIALFLIRGVGRLVGGGRGREGGL